MSVGSGRNRGPECLSLSNALEQRFKASSTLADLVSWLNHQGCQGLGVKGWPGVLSPLSLTSLTLCAPTLRIPGCKHTFTLFLDPKGGPNHASISYSTSATWLPWKSQDLIHILRSQDTPSPRPVFTSWHSTENLKVFSCSNLLPPGYTVLRRINLQSLW